MPGPRAEPWTFAGPLPAHGLSHLEAGEAGCSKADVIFFQSPGGGGKM